MTIRRSATLALSCLVTLLVLAPPALAGPEHAGKLIQVHPGKHALSKALAKAEAGDILNMHAGTYKEAVTVSTPDLSIQAAGDGPVTIDGRCTAEATIDVQANGLIIQGIAIQGGTFYELDFAFVSNGIVNDLTVIETCGAAEYGINLFATGPMEILDSTASGFEDAGIYVGGITDTGSGELIVQGNEVFRSVRGIIIEDSANVTLGVTGNFVHDNEISGIHFHNSDGIFVGSNIAKRNGTYGIDLDEFSDGNQVEFNTAKGNQFDLANLGGSNNCFQNNKYKTHQGNVGC